MNKGYYQYYINAFKGTALDKTYSNRCFSSKKRAISHAEEWWHKKKERYDRATLVLMHYDDRDYNDKNETIQL